MIYRKRGAGQLYVDGRLIPSENIIDFISNMNNTRMMTIPHRWQYERDLSQFIDYLNSLDVDNNNMSDVMSYPYFKYLISRYNEYSMRYGSGEIIALKHTMRRDPHQILRRTQKLEWTKFLQTIFDWFISGSKTTLQRDSNMELSVDYQSGASGNRGEITSDDAMALFEQGMKKLTNAYTTFFNRFKEFIMSFVESLPQKT